MNSREYRFIFPIRDYRDIPADYPLDAKHLVFETGVFLPQSDPNWFPQSPRCPARLLLLAGRRLHIVPHPLSEEEPVALSLDQLVQLETGTALLRGWIRLTLHSRVFELPYNTRASRPVEVFLRELKRRWIPPKRSPPVLCSQIYGEELDVKFLSEKQDEVRGEEQVIWQYFVPPRKLEYKRLGLRREAWTAGHLLLVTTASRLIWITDQYRNYRELYSSTVHNAPLSTLSGVHVMPEQEQLLLKLTFQAAASWRFPTEAGSDLDSPLPSSLRQIAAAQQQESASDPIPP